MRSAHCRGRDGPPLAALSLIDDNAGRRVRMSSLAFLGSHKVNGVSALHTELMRQTVFRDLHQLYPERIVNKTNGITFRRWLFAANPQLTSLLTDVVGERVLDDADALADFARAADDTAVHERLRRIRRANKQALAKLVAERLGIQLDPDALFDVHIKRIHEYKRQLLNILETIALYNEMRARPTYELGAAGEDLRRQGGRQLSSRQADHQADQRRGARDQQRPGAARAAEGGVHSRTTMSAWRRRSFLPPICRSRSPPPAWRRPAPAT